MDAEMLSDKTKIAINDFFNLDGNTFNQKKRSLNSFIRKLQSEFSLEDIEDFVVNLNAKTKYDRALKAEIIVRFQLERPIWNILKSGDEATIGKILKNWTFFKNVLNTVTVDGFVNEVLPLLTYKTNVKVIKVIGKNLRDNEQICDKLFIRLEEKYGIKMATIILSNCSIRLIKEKCSRYDLNLSSRRLLQIYKKDPSFLFFYFDLTKDINKRCVFFDNYNQIIKHIVRTNVPLFWKLFDKYKFSFNIGKRRTQKLLPDKESVVKHGFANNHLFKTKYILHAARKVGLHKELFLKSYPDNLDDYLKFDLRSGPDVKILHMPRSQVFPLLNELFQLKYKQNLTNYLDLMNGRYLKYVTIPEREFILDKLKNNEDWLQYYPTNRSVPILKEKLKSANNLHPRQQLIKLLYDTCNVNDDEKTLLDILKLLYKRYKNDTHILMDFLNNLKTWRNHSKFTEEHWEIICNLIEYATYSSDVNDKHFFERHFKWLVDNNKPFTDLLDEHIKTRNKNKSLYMSYYFDNSSKHMKIFIEEVHKRLEGKQYELYIDLLRLAVKFDKRFPNQIDILNYTYILDIAVKTSKCHQFGVEYYYLIKNYNDDKRFNKYIKYFTNVVRNTDLKVVIYSLQNCPEELENLEDFMKKTSWQKREFHQFLLCPHFVTKHLDAFKKMAVDELQNKETEVHNNLLHLLSYDEEFVGVIPEFEPPEDAKIEPQLDKILVSKQQLIIKYIPNVATPQSMQLVRKFCKGDYLKYALGALYKIAYKSPEVSIPEFLQNIYQVVAISVKKHALFLGRHLLPWNLYHDFLLSASDVETNLSLRNILLKKSLEYFIEIYDTKFFDLFVRNLDKINKNDRDLYDYLLRYQKIPKTFKAKYITTIYDSIITNNDEEIRRKRFSLIENLPDYLIDDLELDFMKCYLLGCEIGRTTFINKCLFHTTGTKYEEIRSFIFKLIIDNLKGCNPVNVKLMKNISNLFSELCQEAFERKRNDIIIELDTIYKTYSSQHRFISTKLLLDFHMILMTSERYLDAFAKQISTHLQEFISLYSYDMISLYATKLQFFLDGKSMDKFEFIEKFFETNTVDDKTCLIAIRFLPHQMPTKINAYAKYVPLLESLIKVQIPSVIAQLDIYLSTTSCQ